MTGLELQFKLYFQKNNDRGVDKVYRLLIADDEPSILEGMKYILNWSDYGILQIQTAQNFHEIIEKSLSFKPDISIFDVCIGETMGFEIIKKLNSLELKTKYVMMSGYEEFEYAQKSIQVGAKGYLLKPVDKEELGSLLEKIIVNELGGEFQKNFIDESIIDPVLRIYYSSLSSLVNKIILIVHGEYFKTLSLKTIADMFLMNSVYLGQIFKKETNVKFTDYLMCYRMIVAKQKIETTSDKIAVVAMQVGYSNLNYFYQHFKRYFGFSPSDLRNTTN